jgi:hypothetical protein
MAKLAHAPGAAGDRRAVGLAEEAVQLIEGELSGRHRETAADSWWHAQGVLATALAGTGRRDEAIRLLSELPRPGGSYGTPWFARAVTMAAVTVRNVAAMSGLLRAAEDDIGKVAPATHRADLLAGLAQAWADCGSLKERDRVHDELLALVGQHPQDPRLPTIAAQALRAARPEVAQALISSALAEWSGPDPHGRRLDTVDPLVAAHRMEEAQRLASARDPEVTGEDSFELIHEWGSVSRSLAEGWAREGEVHAAWTALAPSWSSRTVDSYGAGSAAAVAGLLAESGRSQETEAWLATAVGVPRTVTAEALSALARHHAADDPDRSLRLLHRAVHGFPGDGRTLSPHQQDQFVDLAGPFASAGRPDDAERLVAALTDPAVRARGWAAVSLAVPPSDQDRALRLAERAVSLLPEVNDDLGRVPGVLTATVQALARAGAAERVAEVIEAHAPDMYSDNRQRARIQAVALLWPHAPDAAGRLADLVLRDLTALSASHVLFAELLVAVGHHDRRRASAVQELLDDRDPGSYRFHLDLQKRWMRPGSAPASWVEAVLAGLLKATVDREDALHAYLDALAAEERELPLPGSRAGAVALGYAALGDHDAALGRARRVRSEAERSQVLAQLAAQAACLPTDSVAVPINEDPYDILPAVRGLAGLLLPPPSGPDLPRARALVAEALNPGGWHHALPVLAKLAPAAVLTAGESVLAELGIGL